MKYYSSLFLLCAGLIPSIGMANFEPIEKQQTLTAKAFNKDILEVGADVKPELYSHFTTLSSRSEGVIDSALIKGKDGQSYYGYRVRVHRSYVKNSSNKKNNKKNSMDPSGECLQAVTIPFFNYGRYSDIAYLVKEDDSDIFPDEVQTGDNEVRFLFKDKRLCDNQPAIDNKSPSVVSSVVVYLASKQSIDKKKSTIVELMSHSNKAVKMQAVSPYYLKLGFNCSDFDKAPERLIEYMLPHSIYELSGDCRKVINDLMQQKYADKTAGLLKNTLFVNKGIVDEKVLSNKQEVAIGRIADVGNIILSGFQFSHLSISGNEQVFLYDVKVKSLVVKDKAGVYVGGDEKSLHYPDINEKKSVAKWLDYILSPARADDSPLSCSLEAGRITLANGGYLKVGSNIAASEQCIGDDGNITSVVAGSSSHCKCSVNVNYSINGSDQLNDNFCNRYDGSSNYQGGIVCLDGGVDGFGNVNATSTQSYIEIGKGGFLNIKASGAEPSLYMSNARLFVNGEGGLVNDQGEQQLSDVNGNLYMSNLSAIVFSGFFSDKSLKSFNGAFFTDGTVMFDCRNAENFSRHSLMFNEESEEGFTSKNFECL